MANLLGPKQKCNQLYYVENSDGTVSAFVPVGINNYIPAVMTEQCCGVASILKGKTYIFDQDKQKCIWKEEKPCSIENSYNITVNPIGDDGNLFFVNDGETCSLKVEFDYLFKFDCQSLLNILKQSQTSSVTTYTTQVLSVISAITEQTILCDTLTNQITLIQSEIQSTPYSIACSTPLVQSDSTPFIGGSATSQFANTGFDVSTTTTTSTTTSATNDTQTLSAKLVNVQPVPEPLAGITYCLTDAGLVVWENILGQINYGNFLNGDSDSFTCANVIEIYNQNQTSQSNLLYECNVPFGTKTTLINQLNQLLVDQTNCNNTLTTLQNELDSLLASDQATTSCDRPISVFESFDASLSVDIINDDNTLTSIYESDNLFPVLGVGKLYDYLSTNENSGFYVCQGIPSCTPMLINSNTNNSTCDSVIKSLMSDLFVESGLDNTQEGLNTFNNSITTNAFASNWLTFSETITDEEVISKLINKKVKITIKLNHTCTEVCVLMDNIKLEKECSKVTKTNIFVTQCPGFDLDRIRDNKKSWVDNTTLVNREFEVLNVYGNNPIRQTNYNTEDERLVLNTKEIDLDINLASAIETDVWCYISDNPCLLTGITNCDSCSTTCCGDNLIDFNAILTQPLSGVTIVEDFEYFLLSELIDAKNRQTISAYPTLRALYDRYMSSSAYCDTNSSEFDYKTMDDFAGLVGNYWVDIVEQVIPATTIWGSVKIYSNTIFDQQKYRYRSYTSLFCDNPFSGETVSNPINGISGASQTVGVEFEFLTSGATWSVFNAQKNVCDTIKIAQMDIGSSFIGDVAILTESGATKSINSLSAVKWLTSN